MPQDIKPLDEGQKDQLRNSGGYGSIQDIMNYGTDSIAQSSTKTTDYLGQGKATPFPSRALGFAQLYPKTAYKRLGFNPFVNNIEKYGKESTDWELFQDAQRAHASMHNNMFSFFGIGGGPESDSYEAAAQYEDLVALGTPVGRDDTYAWALKQYVQAGYTAAIVSSIVAEELALGALTVLSRGKTAEAAWARTAKNFNRLAHMGDAMQDVHKADKLLDINKMSQRTNSAYRHMSGLQDVSSARSFWNATKAFGKQAIEKGKQATKWTGNKLFPHASGFMRRAKEGEYAMNGFAAATAGFGAFWREAREFKLAFDEADLESAFVQKETMHELIVAYREKHGKDPEGDDLKNLQQMAQDAGHSTMLVNSGLIYMTNKIGFGTLFNKFAPRAFKESIRNTKHGKLYKSKADLKAGKRAHTTFVGTSIKDRWKNIRTSTLRQNTLRGIRYLSGAAAMATTEGLQEYFQEVIQDAEARWAVDGYKKSRTGSYLDQYANSMEKYISPEGAEVFLSGFVMGGFAGPHRFVAGKTADGLNAGVEYLSGNYKKNRENQKKVQEQYKKQAEKINEIFDKVWYKDTALGGLMNEEQQADKAQGQDEAVEEDDRKKFGDFKDDGTVETIYRAINNQTYDMIIDQLEQMDNLTDEELVEAFKDVLGEDASKEDLLAFKKDISQVISRAKMIHRDVKEVNKRFQNPYKFASEEQDDTTFGYNHHYMYRAYEYAKRQIVKNQYSYKRSLERQGAIYDDFAGDLFWDGHPWAKHGPASDYTILLHPSELQQEISLLTDELKMMEDAPAGQLSPNELKDKKAKTDKLEHLKSLRGLITSLREQYALESMMSKTEEEFKKKVKAGEVKPGVGANVTLNTKTGGTGEIVAETETKFKVKKANGRSYWVKKEKVSLSPEDVQIFTEEDKISGKLEEELFKAFKAYMESVAKKNDLIIESDEALEETFRKFLDFYALDQDGKNLTDLLNLLMDPKGFENTLLRRAEVEKRTWENKKEIIEEALAAMIEGRERDFLMREIRDEHNAFMLLDDADALFEDGIIPDQFFDIDSSKPIDKTSKRHSDIVKEIEEYLENRWKREREPKAEYTEGTKIYPEDIIDDHTEENTVIAKVKAEIKDNKPVVITKVNKTNEDGSVEADIMVDDAVITVTLRPTVQPEVATAPTAEQAAPAEAAPVTKPAQTGPITIDTPFEEWPAELQAKAEAAMISSNESVAMGDYSDAVKAKLTFDNVADFVKSPNGRSRLAQTLTDYNQDQQIAEEVKEDLKPKAEAPVEETTEALVVPDEDREGFGEYKSETFEIQVTTDGKEWAVIISLPVDGNMQVHKGLSGQSFKTSEEAYAYANEQAERLKAKEQPTEEIIEEEFIEKEDLVPEGRGVSDTTRREYPEANMELSPETIQGILSHKIKMITLPLDPVSVNAIVKALVKQGLLKKGEKLSINNVGNTVKVTVLDSNGDSMEIRITYKGKHSLVDAGGLDKAIAMLGLPTSPTEEYTLPITVGDTTYYTKDDMQKLWLEGQGKQYTFLVGFEPSAKQFAEEAGDIMAWEKSVEERLMNAGVNLEMEMTKIGAENLNRELAGKPFMDTAAIQQIYDEAKTQVKENLKPADFKVAENYEMKGKFRKFGISKVSATTSEGVEFTSLEGEKFTVKTNELADSVGAEITDMEEAIAEQSTEITPEVEEANAESKETNAEITTAEIEAKYEENKDKSAEDVKDNFFNKAQDDENKCNT